MSDLINRNDIYKLFENGIAKLHVSDIDVIPTVDAVDVVRCKDCKKWMDFSNYKGWENRGFCFLHEANNSSDDFCSYGERKEVSEDV